MKRKPYIPIWKQTVLLNTGSSPLLPLTAFSLSLCQKQSCMWKVDVCGTCVLLLLICQPSVLSLWSSILIILFLCHFYCYFFNILISSHFYIIFAKHLTFVYSLSQFIIPHCCPDVTTQEPCSGPCWCLTVHCLLPFLPPCVSHGASTPQSPEYTGSGGCLTHALYTFMPFHWYNLHHHIIANSIVTD